MANDINIVAVVGRLTRDSELKYSNSGTAICKFSIASSSYGGKGKDTHTNYFDITLFGKQGEAIQQYLSKGQQISVSGELRQDRWEQDNQKRNKVGIIANNVQLLGGGDKSNQQSGNNQGSSNSGVFKPSGDTF